MPPRNNPLPAAVRLFNCTICDKGYPRQLDYENHLRSYDHNHRQRLADMKKLTASNDTESGRPKQGLELRSIDVEAGKGKMGKGFTKIGGGASAGGSRFKKVGVAVGEKQVDRHAEDEGEKVEEEKRKRKKADGYGDEDKIGVEASSGKVGEMSRNEGADGAVAQGNKDEDGADGNDDDITWEEYDFTKPTACHHASCPGLKTDGIWSGEWVTIGRD